MPVSRILTDTAWADVVVDLRTDRSTDLPTRPFTGRRKVTLAGATIAGTRRNTYATGPDTLILKWTDPTGFTAAVVATDAAMNPMTSLVPHVAHLTHDHVATKWKNVVVPQQRGERAFIDAMPGLRQILTDGTITAPLPGAVNSLDAMRYRLAWSSVGLTDLSEVPYFLRDWDRSPATSAAQERDPNEWPEELTQRGPNLVATWQRAGFDTTAVIGQWVARLYGSLDEAIQASSQRRASVEDLATWDAAGFTPDETLDWLPAARYNPNEWTSRFVPAATCADLRERGATPEHLAYLTLGIEENAAASVATKHVQTWLNVADNPVRVCWYIAAGMGKAEAKRMERSTARPDTEQLRFLAAMRVGMDSLPAMPD